MLPTHAHSTKYTCCKNHTRSYTCLPTPRSYVILFLLRSLGKAGPSFVGLFFFDYWITLQPAAPNTCWFGVLHPVISWVTTYAIFLGFVASQRSPKLSGKPLPGRCQGSVTQRPKLAAPTKPTVPRIAFMAAGYKIVVRKP